MADVDQHPHSVHFRDQLPTESRQPGIRIFLTSITDCVFEVVAHQHVANAELVIDLNQVDVVTDWIGYLENEIRGQAFLVPWPSEYRQRTAREHTAVGSRE